MNAQLRRKISRARRALDFTAAYPLTDSGYALLVNRLKSEIEQVETLGRLQSTGAEREHAAIMQRQQVKKTTRARLLRRLCRVAEVAAASKPEFANKFILPKAGGANRDFVLKAQAMLADAVAAKDVLATLGLGDTFFDDLTKAVADLDSATAGAHAGRTDHVGATGGMIALVNQCDRDVDLLDTFVQTEFVDNAQALAAWQSAKNLVGPFKAHAAGAPDDGETPVVPTAEGKQDVQH